MSDKKTVRKKRRSLVMMSHSDCGGSYQKLLKDNPPSNPALTTLSMGPTPNNLLSFYQMVLRDVFGSMGLSEYQVASALRSLDKELTPEQHKLLKENTLLSKSASKNIDALQNSISFIKEDQIKIRAISKIQGLARGFFVRKRLSSYTTNDKKELKLWTKSFSRLITLEDKYISSLEQLVSHLEPLQVNPPPGTFNSMHYLFNNLPQIISIHKKFLKELKNTQETRLFPLESNIGSTIINFTNSFGPAYTRYAKYHQASVITLEYFCHSVNRFPQYLQEVTGCPSGLERMKRLYQLPFKHILKLTKKLKSILKHYSTKYEDYDNLSKVIRSMNLITEAIDSVNQLQKQNHRIDSLNTILQIEWQLVAREPLNLLSWFGRELIRTGPTKLNGKKNIFVHLFTDFAIISEKSGNKYFQYIEHIEFHSALIQENGERDIIMTIDNEKEPILFRFPNKNDTKEWFTAFSSVIDIYNKNRVFGVPLSTLQQREGVKIPKVFQNMLSWIGKNGVETEGVFRVPGDGDTIQKYKTVYDSGLSLDLISTNIHDIAGLSKVFLRDLPDPLVPYEYYPKVIQVEKDFEMHRDHSTYLSNVSGILSEIEENRLNVLQFLLIFLKDFSKHEEKTKMHCGNLAMVFAPNIIRPEIDTVDTALNVPFLSKFMTTLLHYQEDIWKLLKSKKEDIEEITDKISKGKDDISLLHLADIDKTRFIPISLSQSQEIKPVASTSKSSNNPFTMMRKSSGTKLLVRKKKAESVGIKVKAKRIHSDGNVS